MNNEPERFKIKSKDDQLKELHYRTERHDHENILKSLKTNHEYYKKKYKNLNRKKVLLIVTEILVGSASAFDSSTMGLINPGADSVVTSDEIDTAHADMCFSKFTLRHSVY